MKVVVTALLFLVSSCAQACLFATSTKPEGWYEWSSGLFAGDVTEVRKGAQRPIDTLIVRGVETFKGPEVTHGTLTVELSSRYWANCKVEVPAIGARVLVAINPNGDAMLVPLSESYAAQLRSRRAPLKD